MTSARLKSQNGDLLVRDGTTDTSVKSGITKAWANYSQTDATVRDSFSISSVTDDSTGIHTYVFFNNMSKVYLSVMILFLILFLFLPGKI